MDTNELDRKVVEILERRARRPRYANGFEWDEQGLEEYAAMKRFSKGASAAGLLRLASFKAFEPDPPDAIAIDTEGKIIAIELRELVSVEAVRRNAEAMRRGDNQRFFANWTDDEWITEIDHIIHEKDAKHFNGGPYDKVVLVIYTAEHLLTAGKCQQLLVGRKFVAPLNITDAFLMAEPFLRLNMPPEPIDAVFRLEFQ